MLLRDIIDQVDRALQARIAVKTESLIKADTTDGIHTLRGHVMGLRDARELMRMEVRDALKREAA